MLSQKFQNLLVILLILIAAGISTFFYRKLLLKRPFPDEVIIAPVDAHTWKLTGAETEKIIRSIVKTDDVKKKYPMIKLDYPFYGSIFPPEIVSPTFLWHDPNPRAKLWMIDISFNNDSCHIYALTAGVQREPVIDADAISPSNEHYKRSKYSVSAKAWRPQNAVWETIKQKSVENIATIVISGVTDRKNPKIVSRTTTVLKTSKDPVGAPVFYRDVPLMPSETKTGVIKPIAKAALPLIKWRLRDISKDSAPVVLEDMPTCANYHTFSLDGNVLGMDMDGPEGDKGAYGIKKVEKEMVITFDDIISWNDYKHTEKGRKNFGMFSQVSPNGKYVITTLNESNFITNYEDFGFLQSFYPTRGILALYDMDTKKIKPLSGADDPNYVQTNGCWSSDGKEIVFSRAPAKDRFDYKEVPKYAGDPKETFIQYDLYTIPFNQGKGGKPKLLLKASDYGMSNSFPRYSPDGKWIVFVQTKKGQLMRPDSKLYIMPAKGGEIRKMKCNLPVMNSWHSWSPNSRWLVFSSKGFSPFTKMFLTHIDEDGNDSPAILVPKSTVSNRAVNIPEFLNNSVDAIASIKAPTQESYRHLKKAFKLKNLGKYSEAMAELEKCLSINPYSAKAYHDKGFILFKEGKITEALECMDRALELEQDVHQLYINYGMILESAGRFDEAVSKYKTALELDPKSILAMLNLANLYNSQGKIPEAIKHYNKVLAIRPENLSELRPKLLEAHLKANFVLSDLLVQLRDFPGALKHCYNIIKLKPQNIEALNKAAWILAASEDIKPYEPAEAVELAEKACKLTGYKQPTLLDTLAASYARAGIFDKAAETSQKAYDLAVSDNNNDFAESIKKRQELYKQGRAYVEPIK